MDEPFRTLDPRVRTVWLIHGCVLAVVVGLAATAVVGGATLAGAGWPGGWWALPVVLAVGVVLLTLLTIPVRYRRWRFRFDDDALVLERGSFWWVASAVPYPRIQQVDLEHGPVMRRFGLVALRIRTAAAGSLARVPALAATEADTLRAELLRRAGRGDAA